jgi:hypothetical protein
LVAFFQEYESGLFPKGPCIKVFGSQLGGYWELVEPLKGEAYWEVFSSLGLTPNGDCGTLVSFSFGSEGNSFIPLCASAMMCHYSSKQWSYPIMD